MEERGTRLSRRPRLLYIAYYFPPTRASGVYRSRAVANYFAAAGWDVTVITPQRELFRDYLQSYDPSLEPSVSSDVVVERVPFPAWRWEPDIRKFGWMRANFPRLAEKARRRWEERSFPEPYAPWIQPVVDRAVQLHSRRSFDIVLATGNPHAAFAAAALLHEQLGVPYAIDYRDSWTLDLYKDAPAFPPRHPAWAWERRILSAASDVVFVNEALRNWHARRYPQVAPRMHVLQNGWEPDLLPQLADRAAPAQPLQLGYLGTMTQNVPLEQFFEGWRLARNDDALKDAWVRMHGHLGYFHSSSAGVRRALPLDEGINVSYEGPARKADVAAVYDSLDILLLLIAGSRYVTSGKVYEYMATGKPIVSVHDPVCAASEPLRGYPLWFPVTDLSPGAIRDALVSAAHRALSFTSEDTAQARRYAAGFTRAAQLEAYEARLRALTALPAGQLA